MPIYEYNCEKCGKTFEKLVRASDRDKEVECPDCGSSKVKKVFSVFGVGGDAGTGGSGGHGGSHGPACGGG